MRNRSSPEEQHESLEESAEVVVMVYGRVLVQLDVSKDLKNMNHRSCYIISCTISTLDLRLLFYILRKLTLLNI